MSVPTLVQSNAATGGTLSSFTLTSAPTPGSLLVLALCSWDNLPDLTAGWTRVHRIDGDSLKFHIRRTELWTRVAQTGDGASFALSSGSGATTVPGSYDVSEWSGGLNGAPSVDQIQWGYTHQPLGGFDMGGNIASVTVTPTDTRPMVVFALGLSVDNDTPAVTDLSWSAPLSEQSEQNVSEGRAGVAVATLSPGASQSVTVTGLGAYGAGGAAQTHLIAVNLLGPVEPGVFADWDGDGFEVGEDDNLTSDVASWTITRGAGAEITGGATPGRATVMLNDPDGRYNPRNAAGPLYGLLTDGVPFWIGVAADGSLVGSTVHGLFGGRITDITPLPSPGASYPPTVEVRAEDALGWYARTPVQLAYAEGRAQGAFRAALLAAAGETRTSLANEITTMPLSNADGDLLGALESLNRANGTRHLCKPADSPYGWYAYTTRNRQHGLTGTSDAALDVAADHVTGSTGWRLSGDTVTNRQKATVVPVVFTPGTLTVWEASELPIEVTTARPYEVVVSFDDYVANPTLDIASTGATVTATLTPFGQAAKVLLTVAAGTGTVAALSVEGSLARRAPAESHVADDATSQAGTRGVRAGSEISGDLVGTLASARGLAEHVVWRYGTPQLRPTLTVENWIPEMFDLDLFDVIAVTSPQMALTARLFEIVGLTLVGNIAASSTLHHHVATYVLEECRVQADPGWFVLDTSVLDGSDILAY